jgi:MSS51 C-terminal domain/MYND finger
MRFMALFFIFLSGVSAHSEERSGSFLPYDAQVTELRRVAAAEGWTVDTGTKVEAAGTSNGMNLVDVDSRAACLVCGAPVAVACGACGAVSYCSAACAERDWPWHARVCEALGEVRRDRDWLHKSSTSPSPGSPTDSELLAAHTDVRAIVRQLADRIGGAAEQVCQDDVVCGDGAELVWLNNGWDGLFALLDDSARETLQASDVLRRAVTEALSRPMTAAFALQNMTIPHLSTGESTPFVMHMLGASRRELDLLFAFVLLPPMFSRLLSVPVERVELVLVGPALQDADLAVCRRRRRKFAREGLTVTCAGGEYHTWLARNNNGARHAPPPSPHLAIAFNAGLVMYPGWRPTVTALVSRQIWTVVTSFRGWESDAEGKLLQNVFKRRVRLATPPQRNPFGSNQTKRSVSIANDVFYDNSFVLAFGPGPSFARRLS